MLDLRRHAGAPPFPLPAQVVSRLRRHGALIAHLVNREVVLRYRRSSVGVLWIFFQPVVLLGFYAAVLRPLLPSAAARGGRTLDVLAGLILYQFLSECLQRAPALIRGSAANLKRTVFPLEILPCVCIGAAALRAAVATSALLALHCAAGGAPRWTWVLLPFAWLPLAAWSLGLLWLLAPLGVLSRDMAPAVGMMTWILLLASPVFQPVQAWPARIQPWLALNPLTISVEAMRALVFGGGPMPARGCALALVSGVAACWLGFAFFERMRPRFDDTL